MNGMPFGFCCALDWIEIVKHKISVTTFNLLMVKPFLTKAFFGNDTSISAAKEATLQDSN